MPIDRVSLISVQGIFVVHMLGALKSNLVKSLNFWATPVTCSGKSSISLPLLFQTLSLNRSSFLPYFG